jgi:hypothetical protein
MATLKGKKGLQELEIGKIYKGVKRLINSVWTVEFIPTHDGVFIVSNTRTDPEGVEREKELHQADLIEDDKRDVHGLKLADPKSASFNPDENVDEFDVINPDYIFSYTGEPKAEDLKHPDLAPFRNKWVAKKYGVGESMKHLVLFEGFIKKYMEKIPLKEFEAIEKGSKVLYMGSPCEVLDNNGAVLKLKNVNSGETSMVNYNMFNHGGAITTDNE